MQQEKGFQISTIKPTHVKMFAFASKAQVHKVLRLIEHGSKSQNESGDLTNELYFEIFMVYRKRSNNKVALAIHDE